MKNIINKTYKNKYFWDIVFILSAILCDARIIKNNLFRGKTLFIMIIVVLIIELLLYLFIKKSIKNDIKIHNLYLITVIFFGMFYIFLFPPSGLPDDQNDYLRSLEISEFHFTSINTGERVGREYPDNINKVYNSKTYDDYIKSKNLKLEGDKNFQHFANKSLYAFTCYVPQAIGIFIGRIFNSPIVLQMILGKIFNFAIFVLLTYLSIKYIPLKKNVIFLLSLLPITLQEATSLSPDAMAISLSFAIISFVIWARVKKKEFKLKHYLSLSILIILLSLCKIVYLPFVSLILFIPKESFKNLKNKIIYSCLIMILSITINLIWLKIASSYLYVFTQTRGSNSNEQLSYIISNPFNYIVVILRTLKLKLESIYLQTFGYILGALSIYTSKLFAIVESIILVLMIINKNGKETILNKLEKLFSILLFIGITLLIFTSLYMQWTPVKNSIIEGIQGRYFIPIIPLIALPFMYKNNKDERINKIVLIVSIMFNILALTDVFGHFL